MALSSAQTASLRTLTERAEAGDFTVAFVMCHSSKIQFCSLTPRAVQEEQKHPFTAKSDKGARKNTF